MPEINLSNSVRLAVQPIRENSISAGLMQLGAGGSSLESIKRTFLGAVGVPSAADSISTVAESERVSLNTGEYKNCVEPKKQPQIHDLLQRIQIPNHETVRNIPEKELENICKRNTELIGEVVEKMIDLIPRLGMSGLGKKAMELLIDNRLGTYGGDYDGRGGQVISWGFMEEFEVNKEMLVAGIEIMARRAIGCVSPVRVRAVDPDPGGILIILPKKMDAIFKGHDDLPIGEDRRDLNPENFNQLVVGIIAQERFMDMVNVGKEVSKDMKSAADRGDPTEYNKLYPYRQLIEQLSSQSVVKDALSLLSFKSDNI